MSNERDELLDLHGPLLADIREQDDYAVSAVTSISAYSEGVEHALDTAWAKGYRKYRSIVTEEDVEALPQGARLFSTKTNDFWILNDLSQHGGVRVHGTGGGYTYLHDFIRQQSPLIVLSTPKEA